MPTNNQRMKLDAIKKDPEWKRSRLAEWASLHAVRTAVRRPLGTLCPLALTSLCTRSSQASCAALGIIAYKISSKIV